MSIDPSAFWSALLGAVGTWVAGIATTWLAGFGTALGRASPRSALLTAILALGISVGAVIAIFMFPQTPPPPPPAPSLSLIAGHYNGGGLDNISPGSNLSTSIAGPAVRVSFANHKFRTPPVVLLTSGHGWHVYLREVTSDHVDVITQTIDDGRANGSVKTDLQFWFQIIPTS